LIFTEDLRVLTLGKEIIWIAHRELSINPEGKTSVIVTKKIPIKEVSESVKTITYKIIKNWEADFLGIDFIVTENGPMVLEVNLGPFFESIRNVDNNNTAQKLGDFLHMRIREAMNSTG
jgi:glutathione synthase/RimK-type ligase-like ATP-grasp enzyme